MRWVLNCAGKLLFLDVPIVSSNTQLSDALLIMSQKALGMVLITHGKTLQGIFTDGDLRRVLD
jgi:arabinose-5-phosphate isomerase